MAAERSNSTLDVRHRFSGNATWNLPIGKNGLVLKGGGLASRLIGGGQGNNIFTLQTRNSFTICAAGQTKPRKNASPAHFTGGPFQGASRHPTSDAAGGSGIFH